MLLGLAALFVALLLRAPLSETFALSSPLQPENLLAGQPPCAAFSERGIGFDFLGYLPQADEKTMLA